MTSEADSATCPAHADPTPIYSPEFAANPHRVYEQLRAQGPIARIEIAPGVGASLVLDYQTALDVLRDPATFPKDPRRWQDKVPADCPVLPMMAYRPNCLVTDGVEHARLRTAVTDSLERVNLSALREDVQGIANKLVDEFAATGEADLVIQYARLLPILILNTLFGCPPEIGDRLVAGMSGIFEAIDGEKWNNVLNQALLDLVVLKHQHPGADLTSWLLAHATNLTDEEVVHQIAVLAGASVEPGQNLIANTLRLLLSDVRFAGDLSGGNLPIEEALDEVLWTEPPLANYGVTYPLDDVDFAGVRLPKAEPVFVSFAAANTDPRLMPQRRAGNRAHLAWSVGPHACPAQGMARLIASVAIETLLDGLPGMELAVPVEELVWRPGPFHRALTALPVRFPPASTRPGQAEPQDDEAADPSLTASDTRSHGFVGRISQRRLRSLVRWWHGQ